MLEYIGLGIAFLSVVWVSVVCMNNSERTDKDFIFASFGYPSFIYVLLSYMLGEMYIPEKYLSTSLLFMSIGVLGVNAGRVLFDPLLLEEIRKDPQNFSISVLLNTLIETGSIFLLLTFILGQTYFEYKEWDSVLTSPSAFVQGMIVMGISSMLGGILVGWTMKFAIKKVREKNLTLRTGFRDIMIYSSFPQIIWVFGLLLTLLIYMGELAF